MLTTVQPRFGASSSALSSRPNADCAVVGELAPGVVVPEEEPEARAGTGRRPLEHLEVAVRVAEREDRAGAR